MTKSKCLLFTILLSFIPYGLCISNQTNPKKGLNGLAGNIPAEIQELASYFKGESRNFNLYSVDLPKGILLVGQPGSGKTTLAKALSEEIDCPFIYTKSTELTDQTAVNQLFDNARKQAKQNKHKKAIIFIDDFDSFKTDSMSKIDSRGNVLAIMNELDGFANDDSVITIASTHNADNFDTSLLRSGRFDKVIELTLPDEQQRIVMIKKFSESSNIPFDLNVNFTKIGQASYNFTPADLKQLINFAHLTAKNENAKNISDKHLYTGILKTLHTKLRTDKDMAVRVKVITNLIKDKKDELKGFAKLAGTIPEEIKQLVKQLKNDPLYQKFKVKLPKGILLSGPPGTGKTSLVRALSEEAACEFVYISAAEFVDSFVGGGAQKIRDLFREARQKAINSESKKTIIFIDEIDSIGKRAGNSLDSTITELLVQMDGFEEDESIIVIAATNHISNIDPGLLRPGRFSKIIKIGLPDSSTRLALLKTYTNDIPLSRTIDLQKIADACNNFSPADLKELIQKASSLAMSQNLRQINEEQFVQSMRKMLNEKAIKGDKDIQQQLDTLDVIFSGKESNKGFMRLAGPIEPEIQDLVKMIKGEYNYSNFGLSIPKGYLLAGPPGTGKTAIVRALAEESGCEFIQAKGSEFINKYVGVGAQAVRDLFNEAKIKAEGNRFGKTIIFIDELDAIGSRSEVDNSETTRTVTELLAQMDGFYKDESIIVIGATNRPSSLDPALTRAGRFDTFIEVPLPNFEKRKALFNYYGKNRPIDYASVNFDNLAKLTEGYNAADIKNIIDKAAKDAMKSNQKMILLANFNKALAEAQLAETQKTNNYL